ncbi:MAG: hypothetical protein ABDH28_07550 [Brevinematia bacterium]
MDEEIKKHIIDIIFNERTLSAIGKDKAEMWLPFVEYKLDNISKVTKNLDTRAMSKVVSITALKIQKLIIGINDAVRKNYKNGEDAVIKAIIDVFIKG